MVINIVSESFRVHVYIRLALIYDFMTMAKNAILEKMFSFNQTRFTPALTNQRDSLISKLVLVLGM